MKIFRLASVVATVLAGFALVACNGRKIFDKYEHTSVAGWERNDTLYYNISPVDTTGVYSADIGLRLTDAYPFTAVTLIVERRIVGRDILVVDTINCQLTDKHGNAASRGISYHQYKFPIRSLELQLGDSLQVRIRHDMKREILPGISDVGFSMSK